MKFQRHKQGGVAVVTALLLTTLAVTIIASLFWQQQVEIRTIENQRLQLQKDWIMRGALDWAGMILRANARQEFKYTHLGQPWAIPLAETRLDQYVEEEQPEASHATLSGNIVDAQSRYNLNNLSSRGVPVAAEVAVFKRLLGYLRLPGELAAVAAKAIAAAQKKSSGEQNNTLPIFQVEDLLSIPGFTPAIVEQLKNFVIVLPPSDSSEATSINVNTTSPEVLASRFTNFSLAEINTLIGSRRNVPFRDVKALSTQMFNLFGKPLPPDARVDVDSNFFLVYSRVRLERAALHAVSLIQRGNNGFGTNIVWVREQ